MNFLLRSKQNLLLTKDDEVQALVLNYDFVTENLVAQVGNKRALIAPEEISVYQNTVDSDKHKLIGSTIKCIIKGFKGDDILLSRKQLMQNKISKYEKGDVVEATISCASDNAIYLEFDEGLNGKMFINELTSSKLNRPLDLYNIGDKIKCVITKKQENGRFLLSRLSLYKSSELNAHIGSILKCKITQKLRDNPGYFVEVVENPRYAGIFDIDEFNQNIIYNIGDILSLRLVEFRAPKHIKFSANHSHSYLEKLKVL